MATDEEKKANQLRLLGMVFTSVTLGLWEMVEDAAFALGPTLGKQLLNVMENEMGLEIAGENTEDVVNEIARLFVDEFGFAQKVDVQQNQEAIAVQVHNCVLKDMSAILAKGGADPYICPFRNCGLAALTRANVRTRPEVVFDEQQGCTVTFRTL